MAIHRPPLPPQSPPVGASPTAPSTAFDRSYTYDAGGNVTLIHDGLATVDQRFTYDHRDRLTHACTASPVPNSLCSAANGGYDETDQYDPLGNLTSKGGIAAAGR